jgi:hypothetical protein
VKRVPVAAGVLLGGFAGWTVAASFLFVQFGGLGGQLDQPWLAWWLYAVSSPDGWTVALLAATAGLPLVLAAGIALAAWQLTRGFYSSVKPLYGASAWASEAEMLSAGIKQSRSPY